jgi:hypothetical protein
MNDGDRVLIDRKLSETSLEHVIDASFERLDVAGWLFALPNAEFQRCCAPDHVAYGATTTDDGQPMAITVEVIGGLLLIHQYVALVHRPDRCELVSLSDVRPSTGGCTKCQVTWVLSVETLDDDRSTYSNTVVVHATEDFMRFLDRTGTAFDQAAAARQAAASDHNRRETPRCAESIARWSRPGAGLVA